MARNGQITGMIGVYLVAAQLSKRNWIVSVTSRSAAGPDLLICDQDGHESWCVQVKTNAGKANFWLMSAHTKKTVSDRLIYVFVNNAKGDNPEFLAVSSKEVSAKVLEEPTPKGIWYSFGRPDEWPKDSGWEVFGSPAMVAERTLVLSPDTVIEVIPDPSAS